MASQTTLTTESQEQRIERYRRLFSPLTDHDRRVTSSATAVMDTFTTEHGFADEESLFLREALCAADDDNAAKWAALHAHVREHAGRRTAIVDLFAAAMTAGVDERFRFPESDAAAFAVSCAEAKHPFDRTQHAHCINRILDGSRNGTRTEDDARIFGKYVGGAGLDERQRALVFTWWLDDHISAGTVPRTLTIFAASCAMLTAEQQTLVIEALLAGTAPEHSVADVIRHGMLVTSLGVEHHAMLMKHLLIHHGQAASDEVMPKRRKHALHDIASYARRTHLSEPVTHAVLQQLLKTLQQDLLVSLKLDGTFNPDKIEV